MKILNNVLLKVAVISAAICVLALGALFVLSRNNAEEIIKGANGTYCNSEICHIAIYDGVPEEGNLLCYWLVNSDEINMNYDLDEYFYLTDKSAEEMEALGFDISEDSNEYKAKMNFGKYIEGYYYYPEFYN